MREHSYEKLMGGFKAHGIDPTPYYWYTDLRYVLFTAAGLLMIKCCHIAYYFYFLFFCFAVNTEIKNLVALDLDWKDFYVGC